MDLKANLADRGYALCTTPRSGSNYFCQLLESTGMMGRPLEYFNGPARRELNDHSFPDDPSQQIFRIRTMGATQNGVYGLKLFPSQHDQISTIVKWTKALPNLKFIFLTRRDLLGQAISWARALQNGQYRSTQSVKGHTQYNADLIQRLIRDIARDNARWAMFFARTGLRFMTVVYEDIVTSPQVNIMQVASYLEIEGSAVIDPALIDLKIQRDSVTDEWRARFHRELGRPDYIDKAW
jgi:LPS sulfotransferase NodH